jgi:hypothetical protein
VLGIRAQKSASVIFAEFVTVTSLGPDMSLECVSAWLLSNYIWVRKHEIAYDTIKVITSGDELAESPASGAE